MRLYNSCMAWQVWSLAEMTYVETLYGHQEGVLGVDILHRERAITCGGRDNTLRLWKVRLLKHTVALA